jgi:mono/diheme cytochrome c family protein
VLEMRLAWLLVVLLGSAGGFSGSAVAADAQPDLVKRGEYLARAADCMPCHTASDDKPFAGGRAFKLPFGTLYSPNITADAQTGIGQWSDEDFARAMHEGIRKDGQRLYPAFPYPSYTQLSRDDVLAIKAYLFSLPPVANSPPQDNLSFPYNMRWLMIFWDWLYNPNRRFEAEASKSPEWNRGAYLVEALGHCGECHTPRTFLYGLDSGKKLSGAIIQGWHAYNITSDQNTGIGGWSDGDLAQYLASGDSPHGAAAGPMGEAVNNSLHYLSIEDIRAVVVYLRSVPAIASDIPASAHGAMAENAPASTSQVPPPDQLEKLHANTGIRMFATACVGCHGWEGIGLKATRAVNDPQALNLTQVVLEGIQFNSSDAAVNMPAFGSAYTDAELAALANYVTGRFGAKAAELKPDDVAKRRNGE